MIVSQSSIASQIEIVQDGNDRWGNYEYALKAWGKTSEVHITLNKRELLSLKLDIENLLGEQ